MNLTLFKKTMILCLFFVFTKSYAQIVPKWELVHPKYETADAFVAGFNVMDYGADPTGVTDQTALFQQLLDSLGSRTINKGTRWNGTPNGGTLYIPEGKYLLKDSLILPKGVTIRGDWEKPVKGQPIKGTIFVANNPDAKGHDCTYPNGSTTYEQQSLITLQPTSAVRDIAIWYPEQDPNNIVAYPPAILLGQQNYWGNDYTLVSNVTLVNAFDGVIFSRRNGGGAPNCYGIYGTPLRRGIEIDNIAEVGRIDNVDFSPDYWSGSGLPGSPTVNSAHKQYIAENATAVVMRRNDWSFIGNVRAEGYNTGYRLDWSVTSTGSAPNGHNYGMQFTNCKYGVYVAAVSGAGMMFYNYVFTNCDYGFYFDKAPAGVVQIQCSQFNTNIASVYAPTTNDTKLLLNQNTINKGVVDVRGGFVSIVNCDFNNEPNQIVLGANAKAIVTGNRFLRDPQIKNMSMYQCIIDHTPIEMTQLPEFPYKNQYDFVQKPTGTAFYVATENGVSVEADDNSDALQVILNKTKTDGGGIVFLPPGHYNFRKPITIPTGVELKGSVDVPSLPTGPGSAMEIYAGKGDEDGTPFITMEPGSGIRGLVMDYPEQIVQLLSDPTLNSSDVYHYPYVIRGNKDVYIVNIALRACYNGIDLFTNKCDNHYMDYLAGHVFKTGIKVGGGSIGGHIYNSQFNQIAYGSGYETKFGQWPNSPVNDTNIALAYAYCWNHLNFITLENCTDQILFNNFDFGSNKGVTLGAGANGISLGQGIDAGMNSFYIQGVGMNGFNFINSQVVTTLPDSVLQIYKDNNRYIQVDPAFSGKVTFFGADFWGQPQNIAVDVRGGAIELQAGNFSNSGQKTFGSISADAAFDVIGTNINNITSLLASGSAPQFFIQSSFVNQGNVSPDDCGLWLNNLGFSPIVPCDAGAFIPRGGWIATASVYSDDALNSLDCDVDTRWSTMSDRQKPGQWFMVDMQEIQTINGIYLDAGSTSYLPISVKVYTSIDGENWTQVASGNNFVQATFDQQQARYIRVEQTGTGSSSWRIAEFNVMGDDKVGIRNIEKNENFAIWLSYNQLNVFGLAGTSTVRIYNIAGQQVMPESIINETMPVNLLPGIYVAIVQNSGIFYKKKLIKY
jgi:hypothetical protein